MIATFVPDKLTPMTFEQAASAMKAAIAAQDVEPSQHVLALALAKTALETGRWQKIHCNNWGNIKAGEKYEGMFTCFACDEIIPGRGRVWFEPDGREVMGNLVRTPIPYTVPPGHPQTRFRVYANRYDGAYQYVDFVASGRYRDAWAELLEGDPVGYVHALKLKGYFTADETKYRTAVVSLHNEMLGRLDGIPVAEPAIDWPFAQIMADVHRVQFDDLDLDGDGFADRDEDKTPTDPAPPPESVA